MTFHSTFAAPNPTASEASCVVAGRPGDKTARKRTGTMQLTTTFEKLRAANACKKRYRFLRKALPNVNDREPINLLTILETSGLDDALWALSATAENCDKVARLMAADFAEQVLPIWQNYSTDKRPELAIQAARDFAQGRITAATWDAGDAAGAAAGAAARAAARDAAWAAGAAAWDAAWAAARAVAWAAGDASRDAAWAAAWAVAWAAGDASRDAAWDAVDAAWGARDAAMDAARAKQRDIFISYLQPEVEQ